MGRVSRRPGECSRAPKASLFSLSVPRAPVSLGVGPSPPPSLFSDREYDGYEEEDLDVETVFSSESREFPSEQPPSDNPSGRELAHLFGEIVGRATKALNIVLPEKSTAAASRFEAEAEESLRAGLLWGLNKDSKAMESLLEPAGGCLSGKGVPVCNDVPGFGVQGAGSGIRLLVGSLWVVRRHLWLYQSKLQPADRDCLLRVPVEPCLGHRPPPCCNGHGIAVTVQRRCQSPSKVGGSGQGAQERLHLGRRLSQ
ncbi:unnamed protein product [Arctogadus glacialis]